jgi:hypothetical protein
VAVLQRRTCDLCAKDVPPEEVMGMLYLPTGTPEEIERLVREELRNMDPMAMMLDGQRLANEATKKHQGKRWDVCRECVEGLTRWTGEAMLKWAAAGFRRLPER